ncbi:CLUMA_CG011323, isoform A [Clunio marinus]|uniref:CLUMA_CG011323, isoform A n=1 Tax=Clunio marinus TaxID=568069 RepID=A0A1J1IFY6_9DIPT|nr:CLUMA_CG011323, isoform A [Clunio marinus]
MNHFKAYLAATTKEKSCILDIFFFCLRVCKATTTDSKVKTFSCTKWVEKNAFLTRALSPIQMTLTNMVKKKLVDCAENVGMRLISVTCEIVDDAIELDIHFTMNRREEMEEEKAANQLTEKSSGTIKKRVQLASI